MTSVQTLDLLRAYESRNITFVEADGSWPIVWSRAKGVHVRDADGRRYLDLTAAFGVAAAGHANPSVVSAGRKQMESLLHAMGDVHPHPWKALLARELSRLTFERWAARGSSRSRRSAGSSGKTIFCNSGFEAVEAALKTAMRATGKPCVIAFKGAYHGLGYGALNATHRAHFRRPFGRQLRQFARFVPFPDRTGGPLAGSLALISKLLSREDIGAILVEPIQVRGGIRIPPPGFLSELRRICDRHGALLILDEVYTGFGRTGKWFACEHSSVTPDLICLGKALTGGFPLSACVGRADLMDRAWPPSTGEAIHTSTFLGHPVGCAMALAQIREIRARALVRRSSVLGEFLKAKLSEACAASGARIRKKIRGQGLLAGVELREPDGKPATTAALMAMKAMLRKGFIVLPEGEYSNIISFTPPLTITRDQILSAVKAFADVLAEIERGNSQCRAKP
jgi:4-aminobutyrate aminotransferase-like enzyme